jgi:hypothetical protein
VDNNLSPSLARSLQPLFSEHEFVALRKKFPANIKDVERIAVLDSEGGWAALTAERRLKTRPTNGLPLSAPKSFSFF